MIWVVPDTPPREGQAVGRTRPVLGAGRLPWLVAFSALAVRLVYLLQASTSPLFAHPVVDSQTYAEQAAWLASGHWLGRGEGPFWQPPLYPYLLGVIRALFPESFFYAARGVQAGFGAASCGLILWLGRRWFGPAAGLLAAGTAALYGPLIYFDGELLPASLAVLLNLVGLALLVRALERRSSWGFVLAGAAFALAALAVSTVLAFVPAAAAWIWWRLRAERGARLAGLFLLSSVLTIAPVTARNWFVGGDFVFISYNGGINFYVGNNPEYPATLQVRPGWEWEDLAGLPLAQGIVRPSAKSAYFYARAWAFMAAQPLAYARLLLEKTAAFWHGGEVGRNQPIYYWRRYSWLLSATLWKWIVAFPFGLVAPLALYGLLHSVRREGLSLPALFAVTYGLGVVLFFVVARYRLPVVPVLLLFAAHGLRLLHAAYLRRDSRGLAGAIAACVLFAVAANWRVGGMDMGGDATIHYNLGNAYAAQSRGPAAQREFEQAVELDPEYWQAWFNLGTVRAMAGDMAGATELFAKVSRAVPDRVEVWVNLAHAHLFRGQEQEAVAAYGEALRAEPAMRRTYVELLTLLLKRGDQPAADRVLQQAMTQFPGEVDALRAMYGRLKEGSSREQ